MSDVGDDWFEVSLIPETLAVTTLGTKVVGDTVNIETDILARHVERMLAFDARAQASALSTDTTDSPADATAPVTGNPARSEA